MIFRNSINSIIRLKGKAALFTLLIFSLTLALSLSVSVWAAVGQFLSDCEDYYTTIALFEYMGTSFPNDEIYDQNMAEAAQSFDVERVANDPAVEQMDMQSRALGYIDGFWRSDNYMPYQNISILVVGNVSTNDQYGDYDAIIMDVIYSYVARENTVVIIDKDFGTFQRGHFYLIIGETYYNTGYGRNALPHFRAVAALDTLMKTNGISFPRLLDVTTWGGGNSFRIPENSQYMELAKTLEVANNSVFVNGTSDLMAEFLFHQQVLYIIKGREFTEEEYAQGSKVIVVSEILASRLNIDVGDNIQLSVVESEIPGIYQSFWAGNGFAYTDTYNVVGITNTVIDKGWYVFVPQSTEISFSPYPVGYTLGQATIKNSEVADFVSRVEPTLGDRIELTIYDQGYAAVAQPYKTVFVIAKIVTIVCAILEFAVLVLFGFLFVYRQRETSETMLMLGAGKAKVSRYFFFGSSFIALIASTAGALVGFFLHKGILLLVSQITEYFASTDTRYSNWNLSIVNRLGFSPDLSWNLFCVVGLIVFSLAVTACLGFTFGTFLHSRPSQKKLWGPKKERKTSHLRGGSIKYALLSIFRGGARSFLVPFLGIAVVIFFGQLLATMDKYQEQRDALYDTADIDAYYTDINGKQLNNLVVSSYNVANLYRSGLIDELAVSRQEKCVFTGISRLANGQEREVEVLQAPQSRPYAIGSIERRIEMGSDLVATNSLRLTPAFFYSDFIVMDFLDGYDESILGVASDDPRILSCILPTTLMEQYGIALGDTIRLTIGDSYEDYQTRMRVFRYHDLLVVGSYEPQGPNEAIYIPLALKFDSSLIWEDGVSNIEVSPYSQDDSDSITPDEKDILQTTTFRSVNFHLTDPHHLTDLKNFLSDYGFSQVQEVDSIREFVVIRDGTFSNAMSGIMQQIRYMNLLYPCLYILIGIIGYIVSYLLVNSRKNEFAVIRGLGGTTNCTFFSFFFEQLFICSAGVVAGLGVWWFFFNPPTIIHLLLVAGFLLSYLIGCSASIKAMNTEKVLTILLDKD